MRRWHGLGLAMLLGLGGCLPGYLTGNKQNEKAGIPVPALAGIDGQGQTMRLSDFQGKVVLLSFWHSRCPPCKACFPHEKELVKRYAGKQFALVGVNTDPSPFEQRRTEEKEKLTWPSFWDGPPGAISLGMQVDRFPTFCVIDQKGLLRHRQVGVPAAGQLEKKIDELLDEKSASEKSS